MAAPVAGSTEYLESVNEALEVGHAGEIVNVNYNLAHRDYKLKAKKQLLHRVQNLIGRTDEQQKLSKPIMNEVHDYDLNYLSEMVDKVKAKKHLLQRVQNLNGMTDESQMLSKPPVMNEVHDYDLNYLTEMVDKVKAKKHLLQRVQNLNGMTDEPQMLSKPPVMNEVHEYDLSYLTEMVDKVKGNKHAVQRVQSLSKMIDVQLVLSKLIMNEVSGDFVENDDDLNCLKEKVGKLGDKITGFKKKQEYIFAGKSQSAV